MNRLTKACVLATAIFSIGLTPLAPAFAASGQMPAQNLGLWQQDTQQNVQQIRHSRHHHHHYNRHHHHRYHKHRGYKSRKYCRYSYRHGGMVCYPRYR